MNWINPQTTPQQLVGIFLGVLGIAIGVGIFFGAYFVLSTQYGGGFSLSDLKMFGTLSLVLSGGLLGIAYSVYYDRM